VRVLLPIWSSHRSNMKEYRIRSSMEQAKERLEVEKLIEECREECEGNTSLRKGYALMGYMTRILEVTSDHREMKMTTIEISINGHELSSDDVSKLVGDINKMEY